MAGGEPRLGTISTYMAQLNRAGHSMSSKICGLTWPRHQPISCFISALFQNPGKVRFRARDQAPGPHGINTSAPAPARTNEEQTQGNSRLTEADTPLSSFIGETHGGMTRGGNHKAQTANTAVRLEHARDFANP